MLTLKSEKELALILQASQVVASILNEIKSIVKPGISTASIDDYADNMCKEFGVLPAFKGYRGFPRSICISINDEVMHGIPNPNRYLQEGDIVGLDFGVICEGWY
ncbi:MAG: methionyl aminopeptidase, partial [Deltaproteobacteria bacterium]|nr:methionyl aminopeptidase [Deltaproteobacteria bacterium]